MTKTQPVSPKKILVIDDIPSFCREVQQILSGRDTTIQICTNPLHVVEILRHGKFDLVITTLVMKKMGGFDLVRQIRGHGFPIPIIMITGFGSHESAIEAQRIGVSDYLYKPVAPDELKARVRKVLGQFRQEADGGFRLDKLVSRDPAMKAIFDMVEAIAISNSRVLILGETGTGKQLMAQAIHSLSPRKNEPFIEINCAAIPEALLESEFFGHEKGAFTGAVNQRIGRFEEARGGTIFLDEIGEIGYELQAKLLRVLQDGKFSRVGGSTTLRSNARVIAATNRNLRVAAQEGRFRMDLFYRLHVISLTIPALRDRKKDLPFLARYFLRRYLSPDRNLEFTEEALRMMDAYSWPGNVRELEHLMERFSVLHPRPVVEAQDLPKYIQQAAAKPQNPIAGDPPASFREAKRTFERSYLENALRLHRGNMAQAARYAKLDRSQFFRMVRNHDLDPKRFINASK